MARCATSIRRVFRDLVTNGVRRLQAAGVDVILMDNQQSPRAAGEGR